MARSNLSKKQCVLVIDDEAAVLETIKDVLECYGFIVYTASSGKEAIAVFRDNQHDIDMVLLDFLLPDMSGEWIFENLRSLDPDVRVVLLTGCEESVADRMLKRGLRGCLQKPFDLPELVERVRDAINSPVLASPVAHSLA
jgi:two-component system cell cycle sensor histidine kinase/response regulator CckA